MNRLATINGRRIDGFRFTTRQAATRYAYRCTKPQRVILGDAPQYWVVTPADAERLVRAGYEYAD